MPSGYDSGVGPWGFGLAPGDSQTWVASGVPFGLTSFWTAMATWPAVPGGTVEVTHVYHNTRPDTGLIERYVVVLNRGENITDYALFWVQIRSQG
jgi:hypothetical protein